jgi:predicted dehydrogenase
VIRVALLGGGFMGATHAAAWSALDGRARLSHVVSRSLEKAARLAEPAGATAGTDPWAPLEDPEVDAVDICLPTPLHREATERALAAGKHVLLEKPIALTLADADAIVAAAEGSDRVVVVGHVLRHFPAYAELRRRVAAGELGPLRALTAQRLSAAPDWAEWLTDPARSGGVAVDLMVHDFDQANLFLGPARRAFARPAGAEETGALAVVEHERGTAVLEGSMAMPASYPFSSLVRLTGDEGVAEYAFSAQPAEDGGNIGEPSLGAVRLFPRTGAPVELPAAADDPWALQAAAFADCIERGAEPEHGTVEQARDALRVALAVRRSLASGAPEPV